MGKPNQIVLLVLRFAIAAAGLLVLAGCAEETRKPSGKAAISLALTEFSYAFRNGRHTYFHNRVFTETGGVTIVRGRVCVVDGANCVDALVNYRIEALKTLVQKGHHVATPKANDRITLHYWAEDDAGNKFEFEQILRSDNKTISVE